MSRKIIFFINPISGTKTKWSLEKKIIKACEEKSISFEILQTSKEGDYNFLQDKIDKETITDIVVCGGDGSLAPIVSATLNKNIQIGIIPMGSGNGVARTAGIPKSIDSAMQVILKGRAFFVDAFFINGLFGCHVCGLGFDAKVAYDFSKQKKRGLNSYTKLAIRNFLSATTYPFKIETGDTSFETNAFLISIANSNQFGNNFKIAPQASLCDGLLDIVILKKSNKAKIVLSFVQQILSGEVKNINAKDIYQKDILYFQTNVLKIHNPQKALLHIDGDPAPTSNNFLIEIIPSAYKLIQP